jgi:hypothetical protein
LGVSLEKGGFCVQGDVPRTAKETDKQYSDKKYKATVLNTFDCFGSHTFQHRKRDSEIRALIVELQPKQEKVLNVEKYFSRPAPIGCALRIFC